MSLFKQVRSKLLPAAAVSVLTAGLIAGAGLQHSEQAAAKKNSLTKTKSETSSSWSATEWALPI